jgi:rod shape-determining protein MreD
MQWLLPTAPALAIVALTLLVAMPWGVKLPQDLRFLLPLIPYAVIHHWADRRPQLVPAWLVFASGVATDVLTYGPLGYWALVYLVGYLLVELLGGDGEKGALRRWAELAATLAALALVEWVVASVYFVGSMDFHPFLLAALAAALGYPLIALLLRPIDRLWERPANDTLARGA